MASLELYINNQLCEIESPENFSVYLKRQLLNPAELSTKDAQRSYDISLPATATNNAIFGYTNTEEVRGKFSQLYDAQLLVNGIKIFDGKFKVSEIGKDHYKGNLGIPAAKTVKDIFGEKMMNQLDDWMIGFKGVEDMTFYNNGTAKDADKCFFPLVLYGLLPKKVKEFGVYTSKHLFDNSVALRLNHMPPSINCLKVIEKIFDSEGLNISGTAFNDERLTNLFMSYQNPPEYQMPWNYGELAKMRISGNWANVRNGQTEVQYCTHADNENFVIADLLNSSNLILKDFYDTGNHINQFETTVKNRQVQHNEINIPNDGFYKITLETKMNLGRTINKIYNENGTIVISERWKDKNNMEKCRFEIKLLRYKKGQDIELNNVGFDNIFYKENMNQIEFVDTYPKYFPQPGGINLIDIKQNPALLCGFSFNQNKEGHNPIDKDGLHRNLLVKKCGNSWDLVNYKDEIENIVVDCPVYYKVDENKEIENREDIYNPDSDFYIMRLLNTPFKNEINKDNDNYGGNGCICMIAWLEAGDKLTLGSCSDMGDYDYTEKAWIEHSIDFDLSVEAFRRELDDGWLQVKDWTGTGDMYWDDAPTFLSDKLNLTKFLPSKIKINDWIENFCKAFNLNLIQTDNKNFELNIRQPKSMSVSSVIDLDKKLDTNKDRRNNSLGLPSVYEIGFTVDKEEEGYDKSDKKEEGRYETGSPELKKVSQTTSFSCNWMKTLENSLIKDSLQLPIISDKKVWEDTTMDYQKMQEENYTDKAQRFWYRTIKTFPAVINGNKNIEAGLVATYIDTPTPMNLNYKNEEDSILTSYFTLLTDADNCYTTVECYLTPEEYINIPDSWIRLNNDLYYVAEVDGYDPLSKKKALLKLIRKIFLFCILFEFTPVIIKKIT